MRILVNRIADMNNTGNVPLFIPIHFCGHHPCVVIHALTGNVCPRIKIEIPYFLSGFQFISRIQLSENSGVYQIISEINKTSGRVNRLRSVERLTICAPNVIS